MKLRIDYLEMTTPDIAGSKAFLAQAFGWSFVDYGPEYAAFADAGIDGGLDGHSAGPPSPPLVILKADDLEAAFEAVKAAGAEITRPIFSFPGGRRFQFREPGGNEMGVWAE